MVEGVSAVEGIQLTQKKDRSRPVFLIIHWLYSSPESLEVKSDR